jgi:hypothetical protein
MHGARCPVCRFDLPPSAIRPMGMASCSNCGRDLLIAQPYRAALAILSVIVISGVLYAAQASPWIWLVVVPVALLPTNALFVVLFRFWMPLPMSVLEGPWTSYRMSDSDKK